MRRSNFVSCLSIRRLKRRNGLRGTITLPAASSSLSITNQTCDASLVTAFPPWRLLGGASWPLFAPPCNSLLTVLSLRRARSPASSPDCQPSHRKSAKSGELEVEGRRLSDG